MPRKVRCQRSPSLPELAGQPWTAGKLLEAALLLEGVEECLDDPRARTERVTKFFGIRTAVSPLPVEPLFPELGRASARDLEEAKTTEIDGSGLSVFRGEVLGGREAFEELIVQYTVRSVVT